MSNPNDDDLDPEAARFLSKVRWLMMIAGATTLVAVAAVIGVIGYRVSRMDGSAVTAEATALVPKGARVVATAVSEERLVVTLDIGGATEIRTFDLRTLKQVGRLKFASEP